MKTKTLEKLFDQFLVENDCFDEFMCEFHYDNKGLLCDFLEFNHYSLILAAFPWEHTPQRYWYWHDIDGKWQKYLKENL